MQYCSTQRVNILLLWVGLEFVCEAGRVLHCRSSLRNNGFRTFRATDAQKIVDSQLVKRYWLVYHSAMWMERHRGGITARHHTLIS